MIATSVHAKKVIANSVFAYTNVNSGEYVDLFIIAGQSNAEGRGSSASSPAALNGRYVDNTGVITSPLADPVGGASTGSMWPAFSNEWYAQTGKKSVFIECATGGSTLVSDHVDSWSPTGSLRAQLVSDACAAINALVTSATYALRNVYIVWAQGEGDAQGAISKEDYKEALKSIAAYFKEEIPRMKAMGIVQTGRAGAGGSNSTAWSAIRQAQEEACAEDDNLVMLYRGTSSFLALGIMADSLHYAQAGLNIAGKCAARELALGPTATPSAPVVVNTATMPTPNTTATASRTVSHTTHANTDYLIVVASSQRLTTNTTFTLSSCTFNGVAMTEVGEVNAGNGTTPSRTNVAIYYLDEATYGASLGGVTANIVLTSSNTANLSGFAAISCTGDGYVAASSSTTVTGGATGKATTTNILTNGDCVVVTGVACVSANNAIPTATGSGTEVMDHGLAGGTRAGAFAAYYQTATGVTDVSQTVTWTETCACIAHTMVAFRGKISGE